MALTTFPRALNTILKNLQNFEIRHLDIVVTNFKIWVLTKFLSKKKLFFSNGLQTALGALPRALQNNFEKSPRI